MTNSAPMISDVLLRETVELELNEIEDKEQLIRHLSQLLFNVGKIRSVDEFVDAVYQRESMGPTYMSENVAFPHAKSDAVISAGVAFGRSKDGVLYESDDISGLAKIVFLIAIPDEMESSTYIEILKNLARLLMREEFRESLLKAKCYEDVIGAVQHHEALLTKRALSQ